MKTRNSNIETIKQDSGCCGSITEPNNTSNQQCCEQPTDGSSCCDESETKEVNIEKTGCC